MAGSSFQKISGTFRESEILMEDLSNSRLGVPAQFGKLEKLEGIAVGLDLGTSDLRLSVESHEAFRKVRIEHPASRSLIYGFMGRNEDMVASFERILFRKLAAGVRRSGADAGYIQTISVPARWQSQGIGASLLTAALRVMERAGIHEVYLDAYPAEAQRFEDLVCFYERHGFRAAPDCADDQYPEPFIMKADLRRE
jgi:GNAT superfamily N-acetyltransferase